MKGKDTMKAAIGMLAVLMGLSPALSAAENGKSPAILLQEALYQEQTEGDLDKAIELYGQVLEQAADVERLAARATYQLGLCHLKKGDEAAATEYFRKAVKNYPKQTSVVKKAQLELDKIAPNQETFTYSFGPVLKQTINDDGVGEDFMFDLDNGKSYSASDAQKENEPLNKSLEDFVMKSGVDLFGETSKKSLMGVNMIVFPVHNERWEMSRQDVIEQVSLGKPGTPTLLSADGELPKTYVFKTGQGGMGILQILEMQDGKAPRHFKIQYKMLQKQSGGLYEQATPAVWSTISSMYGQVCAKAGMKNLYTNSNIHFVDADFGHYRGGYGFYTNRSDKPVSGRVRISCTSYPNQKYYDITGNPLNAEIVPDKKEKELYQIYLDLPQALVPGQFYPYAWELEGANQLSSLPFNENNYVLEMQNHFGSHAFEVFYLVIPNDIETTMVSDEHKIQTVGNYSIYAWEKEVQPDENHVVTVYLSKLKKLSPEELASVIEKAVLTISTCQETDPRVKEALKTLDGLDESSVVEELNKHLVAEEATIRRSAIYILWKGGFDDISAAYDRLRELCDHEEEYTRGMAALTLGQAKDRNAYETLVRMTLEDKSSFARRCGAYALGQLGDPKAIPVLKKALKDDDFNVRNNAEAAITMLTKLGSIENKPKTTRYTISDNMALDIDSGASADAKSDLSNEFDLGWDNDGGGVLMVNPKGTAKMLALAGAKKGDWNAAIESARKALPLLEKEGTRGVLANNVDFCAVLSNQGNLYIVEIADYSPEKATLNVIQLTEDTVNQPIDLSTPEATIKNFVKAVYNGDLEAAKKYVSKDGHDYNEFMEMLATESNHPFQAMIKAMDVNIPIKITSQSIEDGKCKISWYFTLGRVYYIGDTKIEKGTHQKFGSYLELVGDKWLIRDI